MYCNAIACLISTRGGQWILFCVSVFLIIASLSFCGLSKRSIQIRPSLRPSSRDFKELQNPTLSHHRPLNTKRTDITPGTFTAEQEAFLDTRA